MKSNPHIERIATAVPEQRRELDLSLQELARLSGVSRSTISKLEHGKPVQPSLLMQLAATLTLVELYTPNTAPVAVEVPDEPLPMFSFRPMSAFDIDHDGNLIGGAA
jgi:transcriptional regulator with XRE-family HTH domain